MGHVLYVIIYFEVLHRIIRKSLYYFVLTNSGKEKNKETTKQTPPECVDLHFYIDLFLNLLSGSYMIVESSHHSHGEKARLQLPTMKENDTHCIDFSYLLYSKKGASPGTLNILVRVNKGPLANPIWNVTGSTGKDWLRAELAVSTFWPNEYQVSQE